MKSIYFHDGHGFTASGLYRAIKPVEHLKRHLPHVNFHLTNTWCKKDYDHDVFVFHRLINPQFYPILLKLKEKKKTIIWEFDDDLYNIDQTNPCKNDFGEDDLSSLDFCLNLSDKIYVTCDHLKTQTEARLTNKSTEVHVLPNLIDLNDWPKYQPQKDVDKLHLFFGGGITHQRDCELLTDMLFKLLNNSSIMFSSIGYIDRSIHEAYKHNQNVLFVPGAPPEYWAKLIQRIQPQITLAPLASIPFNKSKSNIRFLEGTCNNLVTIASDFGPYHDIPNTCGIKVSYPDYSEHQTQLSTDWAEAVDRLRLTSYRNKLLQNARSLVEDKYSWQNAFHPWTEFFKCITNS